METVLLSRRQWGVITGTISAPTFEDKDLPMATETKAKEAWDVREVSAFTEISSWVADSAMAILGVTYSPKVAWKTVEKRIGMKQEEALNSKLPLAELDGTGPIHDHRDYVVNVRIQLADAGMPLSDQAFYARFVKSLSRSLDMVVALYEDPNCEVSFLCGKFSKYGMRRKLRTDRAGKAQEEMAQEAAEESVGRFGQQPAANKQSKKGRRSET